MIKVGKTARHVREAHGLSQREAARQLGVSAVHLCNVENNKTAPSQALLERYRELWDVDLYVLAWCLHGEVDELPAGVREAGRRLAEAWQEELGALATRSADHGGPANAPDSRTVSSR